jgi:F0F1-type ATP synthase assembly protein I
MPKGLPDPKELGRYYALSQIGLEMVAPIGIGLVLDYYLHWAPWGAVVGAVIGFVGGLAHLIVLVGRPRNKDSSKPPGKSGD